MYRGLQDICLKNNFTYTSDHACCRCRLKTKRKWRLPSCKAHTMYSFSNAMLYCKAIRLRNWRVQCCTPVQSSYLSAPWKCILGYSVSPHYLCSTPLCRLYAFPFCGFSLYFLFGSGSALSFHVLFLSLHGRFPMYLPCISLMALAKSFPSTKLTNPYPFVLLVRLSRITYINATKQLSANNSVTKVAFIKITPEN